jgi:hypothetical protein
MTFPRSRHKGLKILRISSTGAAECNAADPNGLGGNWGDLYDAIPFLRFGVLAADAIKDKQLRDLKRPNDIDEGHRLMAVRAQRPSRLVAHGSPHFDSFQRGASSRDSGATCGLSRVFGILDTAVERSSAGSVYFPSPVVREPDEQPARAFNFRSEHDQFLRV